LFWKKKRNLDVELEGDDLRGAFRMSPDPKNPIFIDIGGDSYKAINISGGGACFRSHHFTAGTRVAANLRLPSEDALIPIKLHVVSKSGDLCRVEFENMHQKAGDILHHYILDQQITLIRNQNNRR